MSLKRRDQKGYHEFGDVSDKFKGDAIRSQLDKHQKEPNVNLMILSIIAGVVAALTLGYIFFG